LVIAAVTLLASASVVMHRTVIRVRCRNG